jgi:hypothetical protein
MRPPHPSQADDPAGGPLSPGQVRALKVAVVVMGVLILLGLLTVFGRILYLSSRPGRQVEAAPQPVKTEQRLLLPPGAQVRQTSISGDRLAVHYEAPDGSGIIVLDLASGQVLNRIQITPDTPRR